ncbi:ABC transporter substrate-binding protein [Georgenia subflava]|uniref:PhnD/SsuA/transferrin family substrate-binding protein n=1 Tax=Georgenia subflava TaxID=1622177 RepID=A0A6N7EM81_9MICO|nr:ABC transporter substrate-binding protein [Georgenia subflava]MPV38183.1 PhnD/SsuA/transferrin family substrate-binding protein [Georgenia subflava]
MSYLRRLAVLSAGVLTLAACAAGSEGTPTTGATAPAPGDGTTGSDPGPEAPAAELTIGLTYTPDIQFAPFYVALEKGYYDDAGVDVTLRHHGASEGLFTAVAGGEEDVVVAGGDEMLQARSQDVPLKSIATLYQEYPVALIVPADSDIEAAEDLAGRTVGIPGPFGETYFGLLALLGDAGLTEDDVQVEHIGYTQQAALTAGHVDAVMGFVNNDAVRFDAAGLEVRSIPVADGDAPLVGISLGVLDGTAEEQPDAVAAMVEATLRGVQDVVDDPQAAVELSAAHVPDLGRADAQAAALATLEATVPLYGSGAELGTHSPDTWTAMVELLDEHGLLEGDVDPASAWTDQFLPAGNN